VTIDDFFNNKNAAADGTWKKPGGGKRPWKSRKTRELPTFPTAPTAAGISQTTSGNLIVVDRKESLTLDTGVPGRH
jgi:hypothetical protein